MPAALPELVPLALFLLCFGIVWAARKLLAAMFGALIDAVNAVPIPYLGGYIHDGLHAMEQAVDHAMGAIEHGIDSLIGSAWHHFAQLNHWLWAEFKQHSLIGMIAAEEIALLTRGYHYVRSLAQGNTAAHAHDAARIKQLEREYHGIEAKVKTLENEYGKGIGADVLPRIKQLEREAAHIQNVEIPAITQADVDAADAISNLFAWARGKASIIGVGTFSLAVAAALETLGLGGLRCPSLLKNLGRRGCGMWNGIEEMLGLFVDLFVITEMCEVIPLLETAYEEVAAPAVHLLTQAIDAMPCVDGFQADALPIPALHLPDNPGLALSLP